MTKWLKDQATFYKDRQAGPMKSRHLITGSKQSLFKIKPKECANKLKKS